MGDSADSWAGLPVRPSLVFCLDLQVLDGTLAGANPENKNRCHKTPLRLGFASVMTSLEMLRVWRSHHKPVTYPLWVVFIPIAAKLSLNHDGKLLLFCLPNRITHRLTFPYGLWSLCLFCGRILCMKHHFIHIMTLGQYTLQGQYRWKGLPGRFINLVCIRLISPHLWSPLISS